MTITRRNPLKQFQHYHRAGRDRNECGIGGATGNSSAFMPDYVNEHAKLHEEIKGGFLDLQKEADQFYQNWKVKLGYMGNYSVQPGSFDWKKETAQAAILDKPADEKDRSAGPSTSEGGGAEAARN